MLLFHAVFASAAAATSASFLLPAGSCLAQRSGYICPPKRYITLLCLFGNIVDIIILGYNYHLFSSADFFF